MPAEGATTVDAVAATTGSSILRGAAWNGIVRLLPPIYAVVQSVVAARYLGPVGMGRQSYIAFVSGTAALALTGGLPISLLRYVAETIGSGDHAVLPRLLRWAWRLELVAAGLGGLLVVGFGATRPGLQAAWALAAVSCVAAILHTVPYAVLGGLQRWRDAGIVGLSTGLVATIATVLVLRAGFGITGMFAVQASVSMLALASTSMLARRAVARLAPVQSSLPNELRRTVRRYAWITTAHVLLATVVAERSEFVFLDRYSTPDQLAIYSIPYGLIAAAAHLVESFGGVLVPAVATLLGADQTARIRAGYIRALRLLTLATLPLTAGLAAAGPTLIELAYGSAYQDAAPVLITMVAALPLLPLIAITMALLEGLGRKREVIIVLVGATIVDLGTAWFLVPHHGALGASVANTLAQLMMAWMLLLYARRLMASLEWDWGSIVRGVLAVSLGGVVTRALIVALGGGAAGFIAGVSVGGSCMLILFAAFGVVRDHDVEWLADKGGLLKRVTRILAPGRAPRSDEGG